MKLKAGAAIVSLMLLLIGVGCSPNSTTPTATQAPADTQDSLIGSTKNVVVPLMLPTYTVPQPPDINPGKFIGTVYISDKDKYFHKAGCPNLGANPAPIDRTGATIQGYSADPFCNP